LEEGAAMVAPLLIFKINVAEQAECCKPRLTLVVGSRFAIYIAGWQGS
jgi:hypothetical protein